MAEPTAAELEVLADFVAFFVCVGISWVLFGCILVQMPAFLLYRTQQSRWLDLRPVVCLIFALVLVSSAQTFDQITSMSTKHFGDYYWMANQDERPQAPAQPAVSLLVIVLCQLCLVHRCCAFARASNGARLPISRWILAVGLVLLAVASCVLGILSQKASLVYKDSYEQEEATRGARTAVFEVLQGVWLATSLLVDLTLSVTLTVDLKRAMDFARVEAHDGVQQNAREVLRAILLVSIRNGSVITCTQLIFLANVVSGNAVCGHAAFVTLPPVQLSVLLAALNTPHQVCQVQRERAAAALDDEESRLAIPLSSLGSSAPHNLVCDARLSLLERGRRKLLARYKSRWKRPTRRTKP